MTVLYKLIKIESNKPERSVILDESQLDIIYDALEDYRMRGAEEDMDAYEVQSRLFELCGE